MYNVMIAEDSKPILRNIRMLIQASELPVQVTATASNGLEALDLLQDGHVDILLTDIRMPKLDGLGLIEQAKMLNPRLQTVLISGYSDFEYARRALNLHAFDYLLKPVDQGQLTDVLTRLLEQLAEQRQSDRKLLEGVVAPEFLAEMPPDVGQLAGECRLLLIRRNLFSANGADCWTVEGIAAVLAKLPGGDGMLVLPTPREGQFAVLGDETVFGQKTESEQASLPEQDELLAEKAADTVRAALEAAGLSAVVAAAPEPVGLRTLAAEYGKLERIIRERLTVCGQSAAPEPHEPESGIPHGSEAYKLAVQAQLAELISQRQKERFLLLLRQSLPQWLGGSARLAALERFVRFLADEFEALAKPDAEKAEWTESEDVFARDDALRSIFGAESPEAFAEALLHWCSGHFDLLQEPGKRSGEELFEQLHRYLRKNLYAQLSITEAAQQFHVSPSYISRIVKRYTGSTFVHHYMELKITEARCLLVSRPEVKVKTVAEALGFDDPHYFSKVFKEYAGCSPSEYKEKSGQGLSAHAAKSP